MDALVGALRLLELLVRLALVTVAVSRWFRRTVDDATSNPPSGPEPVIAQRPPWPAKDGPDSAADWDSV